MRSGLILAISFCICPEVLEWTYHVTEDLDHPFFKVGRLGLSGLRNCTSGGSTGVILAEGGAPPKCTPFTNPCHIYIRFDSCSASSPGCSHNELLHHYLPIINLLSDHPYNIFQLFHWFFHFCLYWLLHFLHNPYQQNQCSQLSWPISRSRLITCGFFSKATSL